MKINTTTVQRRLLADGWYFAEITKSQFNPLGNQERPGGSRNPTLDIELVTKGNETEEVNGVRLYDTQGLTENALWAAVLIAKAAFGELEVDEDGETDIEWSDLVGNPVLIRVNTQTYQGQKNNRIQNYAHINSPVGDDGFPIVEGSEPIIVGDGRISVPASAA